MAGGAAHACDGGRGFLLGVQKNNLFEIVFYLIYFLSKLKK
jgi:hypothetical protein